MNLATAIRKGAEQHPQGFGDFFIMRGGRVVASCAMGAATVGLLGIAARENALMREQFPELVQCPFAACPVAGCQSAAKWWTLEMHITHLNDGHRWSREAIADWLDREEAP